MFRSALCSLFAPTFRYRECHIIRPCTVRSLPLTEARLRDYRTSLFIRTFATRDCVAPSALSVGVGIALRNDRSAPR